MSAANSDIVVSLPCHYLLKAFYSRGDVWKVGPTNSDVLSFQTDGSVEKISDRRGTASLNIYTKY